MSRIPPEICKFFSGVGKTLLVKGAPGVGKSIFSLSLLEEMAEANNVIYISTRLNIDSLYDQFSWIESVLPPHNIIDASTIDSNFMQTISGRRGANLILRSHHLQEEPRPISYLLQSVFHLNVLIILSMGLSRSMRWRSIGKPSSVMSGEVDLRAGIQEKFALKN